MYKQLNKKEIEKFTEKYLPEWKGDICKVIYNKIRGVKEYFVNDHYLILIKGNKVVEYDFQEIEIYKNCH